MHNSRLTDILFRDAVPHARLRREIHNDVGYRLSEHTLKKVSVRQIATHKFPRTIRFLRRVLDKAQAVLLEPWIVIVVHIVESDYAYASFQQPQYQIASDEPCHACDEDCLDKRFLQYKGPLFFCLLFLVVTGAIA